MRIHHPFIAFLVFGTASCSSSSETQFLVLLTSVERVEAAQRAPVAFETATDRELARGLMTGRIFDNGVQVDVEFLSSQIVFAIENVGRRTITIPWDELVYTDSDGDDHVGYSPWNGQDRSVIEPGQRDVVFGRPTDFAVRGPASIILRTPSSIDSARQLDRARYCQQLGKSLKLQLPIDIGEQRWLYSMQFGIQDILVVKRRGSVPVEAYQWAQCTPDV